MQQGNAIRVVTVVTLPVDGYGWLLAPHRPWSYPGDGYVRVRIPAGAVDYTQDAVDALVNIACQGAWVQIEGPNPRLNYELKRALERQARPCCGAAG